MGVARWITVVVGGTLSGYLCVQYMVAHPLRMDRYLVATMMMALTVVLTAAAALQGAGLVFSLVVALGGFVLGYAVGTRRVLEREDPRPVPALTRTADDADKGFTAVVYFTHGEPETYDPIGWINQFKEFDEQGIAFVPFFVRPLFIWMLRRKYLQVGRSNHRNMHHRMVAALEKTYRDVGDDTTRFYLCFLDDNPRPDAAVIQALNEGASRIVVAEVFLTLSNHTAEGEEMIAALDVETLGVPVQYTGQMWNSQLLRHMFVERANANLDGIAKHETAVLLVGHGQPDEWDIEWPTETDQEIGFRREVLRLLEADGYRRELLGSAWMEFKKPKPAELVHAVLDQGAKQVLYFSAAISADSIHSQFDVPDLVEKAHAPDSVRTVNLGAWNDDPIVIAAIKEKIDAQMAAPKALEANA